MNTRKGLNISGFVAANPMVKYSEFAWSDAACNDEAATPSNGRLLGGRANNLAIGSSNATNHFTPGELNLMSRFSLNSSLTLNTAGTDSDTTTSSSTSSISATTNSSLSLSPANERDIVRFNTSQLNNNNIKSSTQQASNHLLELQKEIKEEGEEIFADINSLINSRSNLYSTFVEDDDDGDGVGGCSGVDDKGIQKTIFNPTVTTSASTQNIISGSNNNNNSHLTDFHDRAAVDIPFTNSSDEEGNDYQSQYVDDMNNHDHHQINCSTGNTIDGEQLENMTRQHHRYIHQENLSSSDFTQKQQHDESQYFHDDGEDQQHALTNQDEGDEAQYFDDDQEQVYSESCRLGADQKDYQALQAVIQQVTNNLPKPCVFFLEGNCRRSDCKYSHDLSNITCKYWIEGFCFKGELCPFLHSYNPPSDLSLLDDENLQSMSKKELNPTFVIESEADFPSLPLDAPTPALNDSTKSSIDGDILATSIKNQILSSNTAVVFKTVKKKRKRG